MKLLLFFVLFSFSCSAQDTLINGLPHKIDYDTTPTLFIVRTGKSTVLHLMRGYTVTAFVMTPGYLDVKKVCYLYNRKKKFPKRWFVKPYNSF